MAWTLRSSLLGRAAHNLYGIVLDCHSHRNRRAYPKVVKSRIPKPPNWVGLLTLDHATMHCPPFAVSDPVQMKARCIFSMSLTIQGETVTTMETCSGITDKVAFVNVT
jgi:hypothetical protein